MLLSHLIWGSAQNKSFLGSALFHFEFLFFFSPPWGLLCSSQPLWLFCIFGLRMFSLSLAVSCVPFLFLFGPLFSPSPRVIQGSAVGSKKPLKCWLLWEYFKRPFHHVHEAALETKLKYDLCETSINSLESFGCTLYSYIPLLFAVDVSSWCSSVVVQFVIFRSPCMYIMILVQEKEKWVTGC